MKLRGSTLLVFAVGGIVAGCATEGTEVSRKDRERMQREMERANRKQVQEQQRIMRDPMRDRNSGFGGRR